MNLIFIYGAPASGKLTIAKELSTITGYALFNNYQTTDIVRDLYPLTLSENYSLVDKLRLDIIKYAARHKTNLIFTYVFDYPTDTIFVDKVIKTVEAEKGTVLFVETVASKEVLLERVEDNSRKEHHKLIDKSILKENINAGVYTSLPYDNILTIDTDTMNPNESASLIGTHFHVITE